MGWPAPRWPTVAVFLPVYLFVAVPGRFIRRHERHSRLQGFVKGAAAAAAGAIAGAAIVIAGQVVERGWLHRHRPGGAGAAGTAR